MIDKYTLLILGVFLLSRGLGSLLKLSICSGPTLPVRCLYDDPIVILKRKLKKILAAFALRNLKVVRSHIHGGVMPTNPRKSVSAT